MTETTPCGRDALALLTLATHGDADGAYDYIADMDERGVDFEHVLIDLAGMGSAAVHHMARYARVSPDDILHGTGVSMMRDEQESRVSVVSDAEIPAEVRDFLRENFGIDLDAEEGEGSTGE